MTSSIEELQGDLFGSSLDLLVHGCNCRGAFGAGVAKQVAQLYPEAKEAYLEKYRKEGWKLGEVQIVEFPPVDLSVVPPSVVPLSSESKSSCKGAFRYIANCATQDRYSSSSREILADYAAIRKCLEIVKHFAITEKIAGIAMPRIGSGLARGDWGIIRKIIDEVFSDFPGEVVIYYL